MMRIHQLLYIVSTDVYVDQLHLYVFTLVRQPAYTADVYTPIRWDGEYCHVRVSGADGSDRSSRTPCVYLIQIKLGELLTYFTPRAGLVSI